MKRGLVIALLVAACQPPSTRDRECAIVRDLTALPRRYDNFVFAALGERTWRYPELHALVAYATADDDPDARAYPPYLWDATVSSRLHDLCEP